MPFLRIGAALTGGVARAAARLRNNRHDHAKQVRFAALQSLLSVAARAHNSDIPSAAQDDLFFAEDEPAESACISGPPGKCWVAI